MCAHSISLHLKEQPPFPSQGWVDPELVSQCYNAHAPAVYGVLMRVLECEECSSNALEHVFVKLFSSGGESPRLHQLIQCAFVRCCDGSGEDGREAMKGRITAWSTEARKTAERPEALPNQSNSTAHYH